MGEERKYRALVSATSRDEAIEIATEAMSERTHVLRAEVVDASTQEGPNSWWVTLWFTGGTACRGLE